MSEDKKKTLSDKDLAFNREMAAVIYGKLDDAKMARRSDTSHFEEGLDKVLERCHNARRGIMDEDEAEVAQELAHVGLDWAKRKAVMASEFFVDLVRQSIESPLLEPTPIPEMPESIREEILVELKKQLLVGGFQGDLKELTIALKTQAMGTVRDSANLAAEKAETKLRDQLVESNYFDAMRETIDDFCSLPYAVVKYPNYESVDVPHWNKNKWELKRETQARTKRVNPHNFWILNGTNPQNAEAVFEIVPTRDDALRGMKGKKGWRSEEIDIVLQEEAPKAMTMQNPRVIMSSDAERAETFRLSTTDTRDMVWAYVRMRGQDLIKLNVDKQDGQSTISKDQSYEVCVAMFRDVIVHLTTLDLNSPQFRPYFVASYEPIPGHWAGTGIIQRVLKASKIARSFMYSAIRNAAYSATPTGEIVYDRIAEFYPDQEDLNKFNAGHMYLTSPDRTGSAGGRNAVTFYNVPDNTGNLIGGMKTFLELVDQLAAIPKVGAGDMSGQSTLGRSYRGIALVQAAESKMIKSALLTFDQRMQELILTAMYREMMKKNKDPLLAGDAILIARSTSGYVTKEANAAARSETLNTAVGLAQAGLIDQGLLSSLVEQVLKDQGVDVDAYKAKQALQAQLQGIPEGQVPPQGGNVARPAPDGASAQTGVTGTDGQPIAV